MLLTPRSHAAAHGRRVASIPGATVEHNKFCVSVHFRNCEADAYGAVLSAVEATLRSRAELHASRGRKVFEIKPQARGAGQRTHPMPVLPSACWGADMRACAGVVSEGRTRAAGTGE